jgi:hypothetical protein
LHSLAHGYCSEASNFENENINLTKALIYGRKCLDVLNRNEDVINSDKNATSSGERADRRRAGIESVLAEILIRFGATKEATKYINLAEQYALK